MNTKQIEFANAGYPSGSAAPEIRLLCFARGRAVLVLVVCLLARSLTALGTEIEEKQTSQKTFVFDDAAGAREVEVDNFEGSIRVTGYSGRDLQLVIHETLEADSEERARADDRDFRHRPGVCAQWESSRAFCPEPKLRLLVRLAQWQRGGLVPAGPFGEYPPQDVQRTGLFRFPGELPRPGPAVEENRERK